MARKTLAGQDIIIVQTDDPLFQLFLSSLNMGGTGFGQVFESILDSAQQNDSNILTEIFGPGCNDIANTNNINSPAIVSQQSPFVDLALGFSTHNVACSVKFSRSIDNLKHTFGVRNFIPGALMTNLALGQTPSNSTVALGAIHACLTSTLEQPLPNEKIPGFLLRASTWVPNSSNYSDCTNITFTGAANTSGGLQVPSNYTVTGPHAAEITTEFTSSGDRTKGTPDQLRGYTTTGGSTTVDNYIIVTTLTPDEVEIYVNGTGPLSATVKSRAEALASSSGQAYVDALEDLSNTASEALGRGPGTLTDTAKRAIQAIKGIKRTDFSLLYANNLPDGSTIQNTGPDVGGLIHKAQSVGNSPSVGAGWQTLASSFKGYNLSNHDSYWQDLKKAQKTKSAIQFKIVTRGNDNNFRLVNENLNLEFVIPQSITKVKDGYSGINVFKNAFNYWSSWYLHDMNGSLAKVQVSFPTIDDVLNKAEYEAFLDTLLEETFPGQGLTHASMPPQAIRYLESNQTFITNYNSAKTSWEEIQKSFQEQLLTAHLALTSQTSAVGALMRLEQLKVQLIALRTRYGLSESLDLMERIEIGFNNLLREFKENSIESADPMVLDELFNSISSSVISLLSANNIFAFTDLVNVLTGEKTITSQLMLIEILKNSVPSEKGLETETVKESKNTIFKTRKTKKKKYSLLDLLEEQMVSMPALGAGSGPMDPGTVEDPFDVETLAMGDSEERSLYDEILMAPTVDIDDEDDLDSDGDGIPNDEDPEDDSGAFGAVMERFMQRTLIRETKHKIDQDESEEGLSHGALLKKKYYGRY